MVKVVYEKEDLVEAKDEVAAYAEDTLVAITNLINVMENMRTGGSGEIDECYKWVLATQSSIGLMLDRILKGDAIR